MKQAPLPQITLCIPILNEEQKIPAFLEDLSSYFTKFHIPYELIFTLDPSQDRSEEILLAAQKQNSQIQIIKNPRPLGRAKSLQLAMEAAQAPYLISASVDLSTPLGDLTKLLQNLSESQAEVAFGTRVDKKGSPFREINTAKNKLEWTHLQIQKEKKQDHFKDPFSSAFVIKKETFKSLLPELKVKGWYLTPQLQEKILEKKIPYVEVPVHSVAGRARHFPYFREYLRLFLWSLRR